MHEPMEVCQARGRANVEDNFRIGRNTMERRYDPPSIYSRNKYSQLENLIRPEKIGNKGRSAGNAVVKHYTELQAIAVGNWERPVGSGPPIGQRNYPRFCSG